MLEQIIIIIRNILYRAFLIGFAFYIFTFLFWIGLQDWSISYVGRFFAGISRQEIILAMIYFIGWMKLIVIYIFLIPALALHWTASQLKKDRK